MLILPLKSIVRHDMELNFGEEIDDILAIFKDRKGFEEWWYNSPIEYQEEIIQLLDYKLESIFHDS